MTMKDFFGRRFTPAADAQSAKHRKEEAEAMNMLHVAQCFLRSHVPALKRIAANAEHSQSTREAAAHASHLGQIVVRHS